MAPAPEAKAFGFDPDETFDPAILPDIEQAHAVEADPEPDTEGDDVSDKLPVEAAVADVED